MALTVPLDEVDEIRRQFGKIGQRFMDHDRFGGRGSGGRAPRRALGRNAFTLHQEDRLVVFAAQHRVVAFDEHDGGSIRAKRRGCKINMALLETTHLEQETRTGTVDSTGKPSPMGEDQSDEESRLRRKPHHSRDSWQTG